MYSISAHIGRLEVARFAAFDLRIVMHEGGGVELVRRLRRERPRHGKVGPKHQPRDQFGRFISYAQALTSLNTNHLQCGPRGPEVGQRSNVVTITARMSSHRNVRAMSQPSGRGPRLKSASAAGAHGTAGPLPLGRITGPSVQHQNKLPR